MPFVSPAGPLGGGSDLEMNFGTVLAGCALSGLIQGMNFPGEFGPANQSEHHVLQHQQACS